MTTITLPRATVEQALEALETPIHEQPLGMRQEAITALRAALAQQAEPVEPYCYVYEYDGVFGLHREFYPFPYNGMKPSRTVPVYTAPPQQAEPTGKESLPVESVVAENATTQQQIEQTPPSDYRRGYWAGFAIGKREGRIEAEDELAQQAEPVEPVAEARYDGTLRWLEPHGVGLHRIQGPLYTAPPQRKPLTEEEIAAEWQKASECASKSEGAVTTSQFVQMFARAVERSHGIGGQE